MASNNDNHSLNQDPQLRRGSKGFPLLPGGFGRSTYYLGAPTPYAVRGEGYKVWDDRGRELIDANNNFTTLIHGNAHPALVEAASRVIKNGSCWGIPNKQEWEHAELLLARLPGLDQVRYTNSGTEAVMTAVRVARGVTGRDGVIMMQNGYHGSSELALCTGGPQYRRGVPAGKPELRQRGQRHSCQCRYTGRSPRHPAVQRPADQRSVRRSTGRTQLGYGSPAARIHLPARSG